MVPILSNASAMATIRLEAMKVMLRVAIFPKRYSAWRVERHRACMLDRTAYAKFRIRRIMYSGLFHRNCEINWEERATTAKPTMDNVRTVFVMVLCTAVASPCCSFSSFSEVNFTRAVGNERRVRRENVEARKVRMERVPMSVWVRAFVCVTMT